MTVIGCGHLGATHAAAMAEIGHDVIGVDVDPDKIDTLNSGRAWFREPELDDLLARHVADDCGSLPTFAWQRHMARSTSSV